MARKTFVLVETLESVQEIWKNWAREIFYVEKFFVSGMTRKSPELARCLQSLTRTSGL